MQLLEEASIFQVVPFMANLELNRLKDDKHHDSERAGIAQEVCLFVRRALASEYRGRFRLQVGFQLDTASPTTLKQSATSCQSKA